ncbi:hypothetical protein FM102_05225 [Corynebacterium glutamicum]|nr:hypothetical protein FM102_05225 [Corynebacterium glutamicum]
MQILVRFWGFAAICDEKLIRELTDSWGGVKRAEKWPCMQNI